ncbi:hypothetical protein C2S53_017886 [Perilla frutescens var. hirtella]|uniref:Uncharacterized protein n=1 Tax=Perilla frutescens var. hirtella TaxID=608512 RepID=A0AAD4NWG2_PERFH|nr:hypothetical protein C2S53_017886 [Perilla frutescens var. hirtella]
MDEIQKMVEGDSEKFDFDNAAQFHKSLKELRGFSSQLYHAADYCKTAFLSSQDKTHILETTKEYVSRAVVVVVDHLGTMTANLECCISKSNSIPETEHKIDSIKQRIGKCQNYSYKISLARFHWGADFSRYHCRYVSLPLQDLTVSGNVRSYSRSCIYAKNEEETPSEAGGLLYSDTYNCKPSVVESSSNDMKKTNVVSTSNGYKNLRPVDDGLSALPRTKHSVFQFQEAEKLKRGMINWKLVMQNKDIAALFRRGKRLLA